MGQKWSAAQHKKYSATMKRKNGSSHALNQAAVQAMELQNVIRPNSFVELHHALDAHFERLPLTLKLQAISKIIEP